MKWVFWISVGTILYTYLGYPLILYVRSRWSARPVRSAPILPSISIIVAAHNEAHTLPDKLHNLLQMDYPQDRLEVVVVSDGSTDGTNELLSQRVDGKLLAFILPEHKGKAIALNRGIEAARGEVLVFTDARQRIEENALKCLTADLADPEVGCVSGELMLARAKQEPGEGAGLYWRMEKKIRRWESLSGSVVGATGALYAARRSLVVPLPEGILLDDVYIPMHVARQGARVVFEPEARVWDSLPASLGQEFRRKIRTLTGNYQMLQSVSWLLSPSNPVLFRFVSHKLLRLAVPFALAGVFGSSLLLHASVYKLAMLTQLIFYGFGLLGLAHPWLGFASRPANAVLTFLTLNAAALVAFLNFVTGKKPVWESLDTRTEFSQFRLPGLDASRDPMTAEMQAPGKRECDEVATANGSHGQT